MRISHKHAHTGYLKRIPTIGLIGLALALLASLVLPSFDRGTVSEAARSAAGNAALPKAPWEMGYRSAGDRHKLHVHDAALAASLEARGARVLADYGAYKLIEADTATAESLQAGTQAELRDDNNLILLNARTLDTSSQEVRMLRGLRTTRRSLGGATGKGAEKGMWLVQFAGAIKPEWFDEMLATGVEVVNYIPNNAYLVYGDSASLSRVRQWASREASVQWDGEYREEYKQDPQLAAQSEASEKERRAAGGGLQRRTTGGETARTAQQQSPGHVLVQLFKDAATNPNTLDLVRRVAGQQSVLVQYEIARFVNMTVKLPAGMTADEFAKNLAGSSDIVFIESYALPQKFDERQNQIVAGNITGNNPTPGNYLTYLGGQGFTQAQFTASNFAVNVVDSGVDNATTTPNHFALRLGGDITGASRVIFNRLEGTPNAGSTLQGCDGHGNLNAHIVAGFVATGTLGGVNFGAAPHADASNFRYGLGVAPFVKVGSTVIFDPNNFTFPSYPSIESKAYNDGARISTNSWGANTGGAYTADSQAYDFLVRDAQPTGAPFTAAGNQEMVIVFAAGNAGAGANTVGSPGTAKNVITAGASENVHPFGAADQCGTADSGADSLNDIIGFSSRGPCDDGRVKPDLMAPGTHVTGGVFQNAALATGTGAASPCFTAGGVCAGPGTSNFFPLGQQFYTASSGTSHSTPAIAGGAALVRQRFLNASLAAPSPAMTKAALLNSARYMSGVGANDALFSNNQGMGLMNLNNFFDHFVASSILRDQQAADTFTASGQTRTIAGTITDATKPFRVTLAWTDAPGPTSGNAFVNNLDLEVTVGGQTYKGNVFTGAFSATGGMADIRNNVESVVLPAGVTGNFVVTVRATNIAGDGVPNSGGPLDQDYALVIYNGQQANIPVIAGTVATTAEDCTVDGKADPGERITVNLSLSNVGLANTGTVTATLQATGGVTAPSAAQSYGVLAAGGAAVVRSFSFTVNPALTCGANVTATFVVTDTVSGTSNVVQVYGSGTAVASFSQNFDTVTAPALPAGWTTATTDSRTTGQLPPWVTATTRPDSAPNSLFSPDVAGDGTVGFVNEVVTPAIPISSSAAQLTFRQAFNLESGTTIAFDGGVLEIKIGGGAFQDILTAGGSFVTGGYVRAISSTFGNPLGGRQSWSGLSGGTTTAPGYITTTVNLPASANGQSVQFRWRCGVDDSFIASGLAGWWIDNIQVLGGVECCTKLVPVVALSDPAACTGPGNNITGTIKVTNPKATALTGGVITAALPAGLIGVDGCVGTVNGAPVGNCSVTASTITWTGTLAGNSMLTIQYLAQVGDVKSGTPLCVTVSGGFSSTGLIPTQTCLTVNCADPGPGNLIPSIAPGDGAAPPSDQKPGSVLFYPIYTSSTDPNRQNTRISMTNIDAGRPAFVHIFFVDGSTCAVADAYICLTPNQTTSFLASDLDPGTTGYIVAIATDRNGCPVNFNYLIGDEYVKFASGHAANLGAEAVPAVTGGLVACAGAETRIRFDGVQYAPVPRVLALDSVPSRADGNDTLVIVNRIGGDLLTTAATLTNLFGVLYDDQEIAYSFTVNPRSCQFRGNISSNFPRTSPRFEQIVPAGRTAWFKFYSTADQGMFGASINFNPNAASSASAYNQGHNLHKMTTTTGAFFDIPVLPVACQ